MDRDDPDSRSIFNRPDPELDEDAAGVESGRWAGAREPYGRVPDPTVPGQLVDVDLERPEFPPPPPLPYRSSPGRSDGPTRRVIVGVAAGGVAILVVAGFVVASVLGGPDPALVADGSATPSPSSTAGPGDSTSPEASASADASPSPTPRPTRAERLTGGEWATVTTDVVNVRNAASLDAEIVGTADNGEIVFILDDSSTQADGLSWYRAVASPGVAGWMAGHAAFDQHITPDEPTTTVEWCAVPDRGAYVFSNQAPPALGDTALVGSLPISTELLGPAGSGIVELAWGTQDQVCLDLAITNGRVNAVGITASIEGCGYLIYSMPMMIQFGTGAVGTGGEADSRRAVLDPAVIGFDPATAGQRPNLADVFALASQGGTDPESFCVTASASGAATAPSIAFDAAAATQCAWVSSRTSSTVTLNYPNSDGEWVELRLTSGSFVGEGVTAQSHSYDAEKGFRVSAERGVDGSVGISVRALEGCGS